MFRFATGNGEGVILDLSTLEPLVNEVILVGFLIYVIRDSFGMDSGLTVTDSDVGICLSKRYEDEVVPGSHTFV